VARGGDGQPGGHRLLGTAGPDRDVGGFQRRVHHLRQVLADRVQVHRVLSAGPRTPPPSGPRRTWPRLNRRSTSRCTRRRTGANSAAAASVAVATATELWSPSTPWRAGSRRGYWTRRGYAAQVPIKTESRIDVPKPLARVAAGRVAVAGVAWAPTRVIAAVEVSVDNGPWHVARLAAADGHAGRRARQQGRAHQDPHLPRGRARRPGPRCPRVGPTVHHGAPATGTAASVQLSVTLG